MLELGGGRAVVVVENPKDHFVFLDLLEFSLQIRIIIF
jgi:hypothetical protein